MAGARQAAADTVGPDNKQNMIGVSAKRIAPATAIFIFLFSVSAFAQTWNREFPASSGGTIEIINRYGRVSVSTHASDDTEAPAVGTANLDPSATVSATSPRPFAEGEIKLETTSGRTRIEVVPATPSTRIDLDLTVPERVRLIVQTDAGEVRIVGSIAKADVITETGTIAVDVPTHEIKYDLLWTTSRPRYLSDFDLEKVKEGSGGKFYIKGTFKGDKAADTGPRAESPGDETAANGSETKPKKKKRNADASTNISLNFTTARGIVLLNVPPNEVSSDLRERPLTEAAKAIVRSGDKVLTDAIRRASPKYFGDYERTLPPSRREPVLTERIASSDTEQTGLKRASVRVTDSFNRAVRDLKPGDFSVTENGSDREIVSVEPVTAPFNLVLLLDVSGSVDNYVTFIRKAARSFVDTVDRRDRISIVLFNDDVKVLSKFTTDKGKLSESLDTFDAGGATAYYDALAYTLADTLRPLKGERTAIVILTDGDDNRSFLSFDGLLGAIEESGALIYPLYVPSGLIAASASANTREQVDPLRTRYIGLTTKAEGEGEKLAAVSGGVYYPITQLNQIQKAYDDIVVQLRTAYAVTFRSQAVETGSGVSPRLKVRVSKPNSFVNILRVEKAR